MEWKELLFFYLNLKKSYPIWIILFVAAGLRLVFFTDMVRGDDLRYAYAAYEMSEGYFNMERWVGNTRPGLYAPVALLYWLFEPNTITTLAFPYFSSLVTLILVYKIARMHAGETAGIIAAYIWAFLPLDVFLATDLLADGPVTTLSTASVYFIFLADRESEKKQKAIWYSFSIAVIVWAFFVKPIAVIIILYLFLNILWNFWKRYQTSIVTIFQSVPPWRMTLVVILITIVSMIGLTTYIQIQPKPLIVSLHLTYKDLIQQFLNGVTDIDYSDLRFTQIDLLLPLGTSLLVAIVFFLTKPEVTAKQPLIWLFIVFLYYEWGSVSINPLVYRPIEEIYEARNLLFLLPPTVVLISIYLAQGIKKFKAANTIVAVIALSILSFALLFKKSIISGAFFEMFAFLLIIVIVVPIASSYFINNNYDAAGFQSVIIALICLGLISLNPVDPYHASYYDERRDQIELTQAEIDYLISAAPQIIFSDNPFLVDYISGFQLGYDWQQSNRVTQIPSHIHRLPSNLNEIEAGFVIVYREIQNAPIDWRLLHSSYNHSSGASFFIYHAGTND